MTSSSFYGFHPLRESWMNYERLYNEQMVIAEATDITSDFHSFLRNCLDHHAPKDIKIIIYGPTRDGKSYSAMAIAWLIKGYLAKTYQLDKIIRIARDESEFLEMLRDAEFQDIIIVDEKKETLVQEGSMAESMQMKDVDNICAAKCLTIIRLKPQEILTSTAQIVLKTHGNDVQTHTNRLLVKFREMGLDRWIGHVIVSLDPIFCEERKQNRIGSCYTCPKFGTACPACGKQGQQEGNCTQCKHALPSSPCQEFIARYERRKLENIGHIMEGSSEYRAQMILAMAKDFAALPEFPRLKKEEARIAFFRTICANREILPSATNRRLTTGEIKQICAMAQFYAKGVPA